MRRTVRCGVCKRKMFFNETKTKNPGESFFRCERCSR